MVPLPGMKWLRVISCINFRCKNCPLSHKNWSHYRIFGKQDERTMLMIGKIGNEWGETVKWLFKTARLDWRFYFWSSLLCHSIHLLPPLIDSLTASLYQISMQIIQAVLFPLSCSKFYLVACAVGNHSKEN